MQQQPLYTPAEAELIDLLHGKVQPEEFALAGISYSLKEGCSDWLHWRMAITVTWQALQQAQKQASLSMVQACMGWHVFKSFVALPEACTHALLCCPLL